ncbi:MAG: divalent-cation tolerance protein CutA [Nitrospira sp.]
MVRKTRSSASRRQSAIVVLVTAASRAEAGRISRALIRAELAACANVLPVRSLFRWKGKVCDTTETLLVIKSRADLFDMLTCEVKKIHSYEVPEIIAVPIIHGAPDYLAWISQVTRKSL